MSAILISLSSCFEIAQEIMCVFSVHIQAMYRHFLKDKIQLFVIDSALEKVVLEINSLFLRQGRV